MVLRDANSKEEAHMEHIIFIYLIDHFDKMSHTKRKEL